MADYNLEKHWKDNYNKPIKQKYKEKKKRILTWLSWKEVNDLKEWAKVLRIPKLSAAVRETLRACHHVRLNKEMIETIRQEMGINSHNPIIVLLKFAKRERE